MGDLGWPSKTSYRCTGGRSLKKLEEFPKDMYEKIDDNEGDERGIQWP